MPIHRICLRDCNLRYGQETSSKIHSREKREIVWPLILVLGSVS
uniref:Uncharacterized protein n=1 Tax=Rhizophora mucronata TaxID=61149 RepID=A0A2P2NT15_RHIMU